jgi:4,4'-diaponeurosporenoate glycosyltransferase
VILELAGLTAGTALLWRLPSLPEGEASGRVSVVVPARDEAVRIRPLLESLAAQTLAPHEVIVVDDGSSDGTAEVAAASGARVVRIDGPPVGWRGKPWACDLGVRAATGDVLVLLDADVRLGPDALARLVAEHRRDEDALVSVQPFHVTHAAHEQLSAVCNVVSAMASRGSTVAFGPCLVTSTAALARAGGFESVRGEVVEDAALAVRYGRVRLHFGGDVVRFRMYEEGVGQLVHGWAKNLAGGARRTAALPTAGAVLWVCGALAAIPSLFYVAYAAQLAWALRRLGRFRWWAWVAYPMPLAAFVALFAGSLVARRRVRWRGRPC